MLDEMRVLRAAVQDYRAAALAAAPGRPGPADTQDAQPPDLKLVHRVFDVDHVPEQLIWLQNEGRHPTWPCPGRGAMLRWPTDNPTALASLHRLSFSICTPFHWRHQIPLFEFQPYLYTFVLEDGHEGEIWRYLISPDLWDPARAAPSLAALFTAWTNGIAAGVIYYQPLDGRLMIGEPTEEVHPFDVIRQQAPDLDPFAFPIDIPDAAMRQRQRECGVDLDCIDRDLDRHAELQDAVTAVQRSLGLRPERRP
jgi:hypothetical protein